MGDAVESGQFNIWSVATIEEGIELLTGLPYRQVYDKVAARLEDYYIESLKERQK